MNRLFTSLCVMVLACGVHAADPPLIYEGNIDTQAKPMDLGGRAQWNVGAKVGNTSRIRYYTYSGTNVLDPSAYTVTFHAGPSRNDAGQIEVSSFRSTTTYVEFKFSTNNLAYPFERWYSSVKFVSGANIVSQPEGYFSVSGAPEVDGGSASFTYNRNWALWQFSNGLANAPTINADSTLTATTNSKGQVLLSVGLAAIGVSNVTLTASNDWGVTLIGANTANIQYPTNLSAFTATADYNFDFFNVTNINHLTVSNLLVLSGSSITLGSDVLSTASGKLRINSSNIATEVYADDAAGAATNDAQLARLDEDETITGNWVNTANPWADNEVANNLTVDEPGIASTITRDTEWDTLAEVNAASTDTDAVLDTDIGATVQAWDATLDDIADGTISENLVNTNNPWAVNEGGSGAATFTDGGVLLGSGTDAITAMSVLADGEFVVGDGTTDPVAESGATLRTSIGVGTGDSPQFTGIELGHATDTTLTRSGAGVLAVEGTDLLQADGSVAWTGDQDASGNDLLNLGTNSITFEGGWKFYLPATNDWTMTNTSTGVEKVFGEVQDEDITTLQATDAAQNTRLDNIDTQVDTLQDNQVGLIFIASESHDALVEGFSDMAGTVFNTESDSVAVASTTGFVWNASKYMELDVATNEWDLSTNLVGHYKLDDAAADTVVVDSGIQGNVGALVGGNNTADIDEAGRIDGTLHLDGAADYITLGDHTAFLNTMDTADFSIAFWVKHDDLATTDPMFGVRDSDNSPALFAYSYTDGHLNFKVEDDSGNSAEAITSAGALVAGEWTHVVCTWDASADTATIYTNTVSAATDTDATVATISQFSTADLLSIGTRNTGGSANGFLDGSVDDFRIYTDILTAAEIGYIYNVGVGTHAQTQPETWGDGLVAHYKMEDNAASTTVKDSSGSGNDGASAANTSTMTAAGKLDNALNFNGSSDYITSATFSGPTLTNATVAFWVNLNDLTGTPYLTDGANVNEFASYISAGTYAWGGTAPTFSQDTWHHIVILSDGTNWELYFDGENKGTTAKTDIVGSQLAIGSAGNQSANWVDGEYDDYRIYNRLLSSNEVTDIYNAGSGRQDNGAAGLVAHYKLNEANASTTVGDASGNGNNGTLTGGDNTTTISAAGKINTALDLDGSADYIQIDDTLTALANATEGTMCWWAYDRDNTANSDHMSFVGGANNTVGNDTQLLNMRQYNTEDWDVGIWIDGALQWRWSVNLPGAAFENAWNHYAIVHDGVAAVMYTNGAVAIGAFSTTTDKTDWFKSMFTDATNPADQWNVGVSERESTFDHYAKGMIDDVRHYSRALSATEIASLYNSGTGTEAPVPAGGEYLNLINQILVEDANWVGTINEATEARVSILATTNAAMDMNEDLRIFVTANHGTNYHQVTNFMFQGEMFGTGQDHWIGSVTNLTSGTSPKLRIQVTNANDAAIQIHGVGGLYSP